VKKALGVPVEMQTDVNAAAQSEMIYGNHGKSINACGYITVGTGVGCGIMIFGKILKGFAHSECGHITVKLHKDEPEDFKGTCPFHGNCVEGLVSAGAIAARLGIQPKDLADLKDEDPVWDIVAYYLAQVCVSLTLISSPQVIVIGGGVLKRLVLYPKIRNEFVKLLNGYVPTPNVEDFIVRSRFEDDAGAVGSLELGRIAAANQ
jgi:fructokinase